MSLYVTTVNSLRHGIVYCFEATYKLIHLADITAVLGRTTHCVTEVVVRLSQKS